MPQEEGLILQTKLHFSRFEFKYILREDLRQEVESELGYFLQLDPYVASKPGKKYMVRSLYFDDDVHSNYYEKAEGMLHRAKFRLRTYTNNPAEGCACFLEIKGRHDALVFKHRTPLALGEGNYFKLREKMVSEKILTSIEEGPIKEQFRFELAKKRIKPMMLIDYMRRPYVSRYDPEFRLTFDEKLRATHTQSLFPGPEKNSKAVLRGYTVMEVKFRHHMPSWFHRIIQYYSLRRVSVSKVVYGMDVWKIPAYLDD
jgi:hypothetical protein